jgi:hypothetical protein
MACGRCVWVRVLECQSVCAHLARPRMSSAWACAHYCQTFYSPILNERRGGAKRSLTVPYHYTRLHPADVDTLPPDRVVRSVEQVGW